MIVLDMAYSWTAISLEVLVIGILLVVNICIGRYIVRICSNMRREESCVVISDLGRNRPNCKVINDDSGIKRARISVGARLQFKKVNAHSAL